MYFNPRSAVSGVRHINVPSITGTTRLLFSGADCPLVGGGYRFPSAPTAVSLFMLSSRRLRFQLRGGEFPLFSVDGHVPYRFPMQKRRHVYILSFLSVVFYDMSEKKSRFFRICFFRRRPLSCRRGDPCRCRLICRQNNGNIRAGQDISAPVCSERF